MQITNIKSKTEDITTDSKDIKIIIKVYSELFTINLTTLMKYTYPLKNTKYHNSSNMK